MGKGKPNRFGETISSIVVGRYRTTEARVDRWSLGNGGEGKYVHLFSPGYCVVIVPILKNGSIRLIEEFRYTHQRTVVELPMGGTEPSESPEEAARNELAEEASLKASELILLNSESPVLYAVGETNFKAWIFLAQGCEEVQGTESEVGEKISHLDVSPAELDQMIRDGRFAVAEDITAIALAFRHLGIWKM